MAVVLRWVALTLLMLFAACSAGGPCHPPGATDLKTIHVVRRGWHTGIAIRVQDWPDPTWPVLADFPGARYLEFGWGEARYYQAPEPSWRMALAAAFGSNPSVVEVRGLDALEPVEKGDYHVVALHVTTDGFVAIAASIEASFATAPDGDVLPTGVEWSYGDDRARFYRSPYTFSLLRMCNRWTAEQLAAAGCPVPTRMVFRAGGVMRAAQRLAEADRTSR